MPCSSFDPDIPAEMAAIGARLLPIAGNDIAETGRKGYRQAAVLVVLFNTPTGVTFLLTERPATLSRHAGQISLPGGSREAHDSSLWETALRETDEEIGLGRTTIRPLGRLSPVTVRVSRYTVTPFVGWVPEQPALRPAPAEVAAVLHVPLSSLLDPATIRTEWWDVRGERRPVTFYLFGQSRVWGATARVLSELASRLGANHPEPAPGWVGPPI